MALPFSLCPVKCVVVPGSVLSCVSTGGRPSPVASLVLVVDIVLGCMCCSCICVRRPSGTRYKEEQVDQVYMYGTRQGRINGGPARLPIPMKSGVWGKSAESRVSCRILKRLYCRGRQLPSLMSQLESTLHGTLYKYSSWHFSWHSS